MSKNTEDSRCKPVQWTSASWKVEEEEIITLEKKNGSSDLNCKLLQGLKRQLFFKILLGINHVLR